MSPRTLVPEGLIYRLASNSIRCPSSCSYSAACGRGAFSEVRKVKKKGTELQFAMKTLFRSGDKFSQRAIEREIEIMRSLGQHSNIVRLEDAFQDSGGFYMIQELGTGGVSCLPLAFLTNASMSDSIDQDSVTGPLRESL